MDIDGCLFLVDTVAKLHRYLRVTGWFHHEDDALVSLALEGADALGVDVACGFDHGGVLTTLGPGKGFRLEALLREDDFPTGAAVVFQTREGRRLVIRLIDLAEDRARRYVGPLAFRRFRDEIASRPASVLVDLGGRDRSRVGDRGEFCGARRVTVDVLAQEGVDIVADAHELSRHLAPESVDFIHSRSVFEHLLMPWKVVVEMNRVMKPGGLAFVTTHQTIGMHDRPWDFLRFSQDSWPGFFNAATGFEILESFEEREQFVVPWIWHEGKRFAERSVGFESSGVMARKTGPSRLEWPVGVAEIIDTTYPDAGV